MNDNGLTRLAAVIKSLDIIDRRGAWKADPGICACVMELREILRSLESVRSEALEEAMSLLRRVIGPSFLDNRLHGQIETFLQSPARVAEPFDLKKHLSKPEQIIEIDEEGNVHSTELRK